MNDHPITHRPSPRAAAGFLLAAMLGGGCDEGTGPDPGPKPKIFIEGNWQFSMVSSTAPGTPSSTIAGSLARTGTSIRGAVHVDGSNCFDGLTTIHLTGTLTGNNLSLTSESVQGQVITFVGTSTYTGITGAYSITGGCAEGDQGTMTGINIAEIADGTWRVILDVNEEHWWIGLATLTQGQASPKGSFEITGTLDPKLACGLRRIIPGAFPTPSYIMGKSVALQIEAAGGGTLYLDGTLSISGIFGAFRIVGGDCAGTLGFACLVPGRGGCTPPGLAAESAWSRDRLSLASVKHVQLLD